MAKNFIALEETSQAIKTTVEDIQTDVGDGAGTDLMTRVEEIKTLLSNDSGGGSVIKSIQIGTAKMTPGTALTITLKEIVPEKTIVLLNGNAYSRYSGGDSSDSRSALPYIEEFTSTQLKINSIKNDTAKIGTISYQVIEFY